MAYSEVNDLLLGDMTISSAVDKQAFITDASDEIDSKIGVRYVTPLTLTSLADHSRKLIKRISNHLASARLLMAVASAGEDNQVQAYALFLLKGAESDLCAIAEGQLDLVGATPQDTFTESGNGPSITNFDQDSAVDTFYRNVMGQEDLGWIPG